MNQMTKIMLGFLILCIFVGVAVYTVHENRQQRIYADQFALTDGTVSIPPSVDDWRFYPTLKINDVPVRFVFDQKARHVVLTRPDAQRVGIDTDTLIYALTPINWESDARPRYGSLMAASVTLSSVTLEGFNDTDMDALVDEGTLDVSILGSPYMFHFDPIEIADFRLLLSR